MAEAEFTSAAGRFLPTSAYDRLLALLTREVTWRAKLLEALALVLPLGDDAIESAQAGSLERSFVVRFARARDEPIQGLTHRAQRRFGLAAIERLRRELRALAWCLRESRDP